MMRIETDGVIMMRKKFLQFFTGKLSKSIYIAVASAVVCGVAVITTVVVVHNNNQRLDTALESLNEQTATLTQTESATESGSVTESNDTTAPAQAANSEPAGDRALEYLAEYDRITEEYEKKRAELVNQTPTAVALPDFSKTYPKPIEPVLPTGASPDDQQKALAEYEQYLAEWESESIQYEQQVQKNAEAEKQAQELQKQIDDLDAQYEKDIAALKAQYGIS